MKVGPLMVSAAETNRRCRFHKLKILKRSVMLELAAGSIVVIPFTVGFVGEIGSPVGSDWRDAAARLQQTNSKKYNHFTLILALNTELNTELELQN